MNRRIFLKLAGCAVVAAAVPDFSHEAPAYPAGLAIEIIDHNGKPFHVFKIPDEWMVIDRGGLRLRGGELSVVADRAVVIQGFRVLRDGKWLVRSDIKPVLATAGDTIHFNYDIQAGFGA